MPPQDLDLVAQEVDTAAAIPALRVLRHRAQRLLLAFPTDHEGQLAGTAIGQGLVLQVVEVVVTIRGRGDRLTSQERGDAGHRLVEPVQALAEAGPEIDAVGGVLVLEPGATEAQPGPTAADVIDGHGRLGGQAGVAEGVGTDHEAELDAFGRRGPGGQECPALEDRLQRVAHDGVEVVPRPQAVDADRVGKPGDLSKVFPIGLLGP